MLEAVSTVASLLAARDRLPPDLDGAVEAKLGALLRHAAATVPWYRRLFAQAGVDPRGDPRTTLAALPVTRKQHWRDRLGPDFHSTAVDLSRCRWIRSSGTTGASIAMPLGPADRIARRIGTQRCLWAAGAGVLDRYVWVRTARGAVPGRSLHERLGLLRTLYVDLLAPPERAWGPVVAWAPRGLLSFPLETAAIAARIADGRLARLPGPVVCALYGEHVDEAARRAIESALGPVREMYGSAEAGTIAWACDRGEALHVNADLVVVEILDDGCPVTPGAPGEIVVTNLHSRAMPVIRYGQGDVGWEVPGPCPCGRPGPLLRLAPGFRQGPFRLPSGRRVAARFFVQALPSPGWLVGWEVEQPEADRFAVTLTASRPVAPDEVRQIAATIAEACWEPVRVGVTVRVRAASSPGGAGAQAALPGTDPGGAARRASQSTPS